jgi:hypothetical protein
MDSCQRRRLWKCVVICVVFCRVDCRSCGVRVFSRAIATLAVLGIPGLTRNDHAVVVDIVTLNMLDFWVFSLKLDTLPFLLLVLVFSLSANFRNTLLKIALSILLGLELPLECAGSHDSVRDRDTVRSSDDVENESKVQRQQWEYARIYEDTTLW